MKLLAQLAAAFDNRSAPEDVVSPDHPDTYEYQEALHFEAVDWRNTTCDEWQEYADSIYAFLPEAFCYFLPGILSAEIKEGRPDLLLTSALLNMLDRSPNKDTWDTFFIERWLLLAEEECQAVQQWIIWLADQKIGLDDDALMRAYETLEMLAATRC